MLADILVIDPPWHHSGNSAAKPGRNARRHYPCMTDEQLMALALPAARDALLFLWTTVPMLERSLVVMRAWDFRYKSQLVWVKDKIGTGHWARNRHEIVLICTRGKFPCPKPAPFEDSVIEAPRREHSRKPEALQDRIDEVWPDARKLELFGRRQRAGWTVIGNESGKFDGA